MSFAGCRFQPAKCEDSLNKPEKANGKNSIHELCRFVFSRSDQKHTIFPLDGTNEQFCGKIVENYIFVGEEICISVSNP
jgi:hypothetical protein